MRLISWNPNRLFASIKNGVFEALSELQPDVICLQEIRISEEPEILKEYYDFWNQGA